MKYTLLGTKESSIKMAFQFRTRREAKKAEKHLQENGYNTRLFKDNF